jgi:hypothetical protein
MALLLRELDGCASQLHLLQAESKRLKDHKGRVDAQVKQQKSELAGADIYVFVFSFLFVFVFLFV